MASFLKRVWLFGLRLWGFFLGRLRLFALIQFISFLGLFQQLLNRVTSLLESFHPVLGRKSIPPDWQYQYEPLSSPRHIRLLRLLETADAVLVTELKAFSIDEALEYDALSYMWGEPAMRYGLRCGSKLIPVPGENLFLCLKILAQQKYDKWIWIDAICINQQDTTEKYDQIPLMREIYARASEVLAWLGDANPLESLILDTGRRRHIKASISNPSPALQMLRPGPPGLFEHHLNTPIPLSLLRKGLISIFHRPYFSRIWTQQEVVLGKRVFMLFRDVKIPWDEFAEFAKICRYQGQPYTDDIINLQRIRNDWHSESPNHDKMVNAMMFLARHKQATEPKDRVYGVRGLCPTEDLHHLTVDVNHSLAEVYIQFAKWNFSMGRFQDVLETLNYAHHFPHLPSWCPNLMWHGEAYIQWDVFSAGYKSEEIRKTTPGMSRPKPKEAPETRWLNSQVLVLTATLAVDKVHAVLAWDDRIEEKNSQLNWFRLSKWDKTCLRLSGEKESEELLLAHATTLIAGRLWGLDRFVSPLPYHADPMRCYELWKQCLWLLWWRIPKITLPAEFFDFTQSMRSVCSGQCYFITTSGRRGICSKDTRPGDVIIVTRNANSPAIVRPAASVEQHMTLIGPAYVHGIMNGEALESNNNGERQWEEVFVQ